MMLARRKSGAVGLNDGHAVPDLRALALARLLAGVSLKRLRRHIMLARGDGEQVPQGLALPSPKRRSAPRPSALTFMS
jgi:hypothetical protein